MKMVRGYPQGTRVGTPQIGTLNGPKQLPTTTQFGNDGSRPNTQSTVTQERGWPPNPARVITSASGTREQQLRNDNSLQIGAAPPRILRQLFSRVFGKISEDGQFGFPYNGEWSMIPHQWVPRAAVRSGPTFKRTDDNAPIMAVYSGAPRR